eukprot:2919103-Prymnesium_polylepis.1
MPIWLTRPSDRHAGRDAYAADEKLCTHCQASSLPVHATARVWQGGGDETAGAGRHGGSGGSGGGGDGG